MRMVTNVISTLLLCLSALCAQAQQSYRVIPINAFGNTSPPRLITTEDLNNTGTVVGVAGVERNGRHEHHAAQWRRGRTVDLHSRIDGTSSESEAFAINDKSEIVGTYLDSQLLLRSYLLRDTAVTQIEVLPGAANVIAVDINNAAQVIGFAFDDERRRGGQFVWAAGKATLLQNLKGGDTQISVREINDNGVIVGTDNTNGMRAVIWRRGATVPTVVGGLPGAVSSDGSDINELGVVLGNSQLPAAPQPLQRAFTWSGGRISELPPLASHTNSVAYSINNHGLVVGSSFTGGPRTAALWRDGLTVDLNERVAADDPLKAFVTLREARLVNDQGAIVVFGEDSRAPFRQGHYLLTPVSR